MAVDLDIADGLATLRFDAPPANAVDLEFTAALIARLADLAARRDIAAAVVTGAGRAFCAGVNFKVVPGYDAADRRAMVADINAMAAALYGLPFPVVAAVNGPAVGGGMVLAMACDFRVAARMAARFALAEVTAGIPYPAVPLIVLEDSVEPALRRDLMLSGRMVSAEEALAARLVDRVVAPEDVVAEAAAMARALAAAPGYSAVKAQLRGGALRRMRAVIDSGDDPMLVSWI